MSFTKLNRTFRYSLKKFSQLTLHPIFIFTTLQIVIVAATVMWIIWYDHKIPDPSKAAFDTIFLITGCVLLGITLIGTVFLFVFAINQSRLNRQQRSFVSSVTHELRSPLASMQLALETISNRTLTPEMLAQNYKLMLTDLKRLLNLVDQILVSARLDRGITLFEDISEFSLRSLLDESIQSFLHKAPDLNERCQIQVDSSLYIRTAKAALKLVIDNLIDNAVKYSPPGSPIKVCAWTKGASIFLEVSDQGIGLDRRDLKRIFKIFARGRGAARRAVAGTGLGLYIVGRWSAF